MQPILTFSIDKPGYAGVNTSDSPVGMDAQFALTAINCVIDQSGRTCARKGVVRVSSNTNAQLGQSNIEALGELIAIDGTRTILAAGANNLFKLSGSSIVTLTYGGGGAAPTITGNNWQLVSLAGSAVFFQLGHDPLLFDPALSTTTYRRLSEHPSYTGTVPLANCAISAYGRIWCADTTTNRMTVTWCDSMIKHKWTAGTAGYLDLQGVWPNGSDRIVALASHNNFLIIFGARQILIYQGANNPSTMALYDVIAGIGCAGRDTIQNTEDDLIFLSDSGVRSLERTIQEKSAPVGDISANVWNDIRGYMGSQSSSSRIKSAYSQVDAFYLLSFPDSLIGFCFNTRIKLENGALRATTWIDNPAYAFLYTDERELYMGKAGYIGKYNSYSDDGAGYRISYLSPWLDLGNDQRVSLIKQVSAIVIGDVDQPMILSVRFDFDSTPTTAFVLGLGGASLSEWGVAEWGIGEWGVGIGISNLRAPIRGSGKVVQIGIDVDINGNNVSIQQVGIQAKNGKY